MMQGHDDGFEAFDEIVAIMVVVITLGAFVGASFTIYSAREEDRQIKDLENECEGLLESFLGYDKTLHGTSEGIFSYSKLQEMNASIIKRDLSVSVSYSISVSDISDYRDKFDTFTFKGGEKIRGDVMIKSRPCIVATGRANHLSKLTVAVWE